MQKIPSEVEVTEFKIKAVVCPILKVRGDDSFILFFLQNIFAAQVGLQKLKQQKQQQTSVLTTHCFRRKNLTCTFLTGSRTHALSLVRTPSLL